MHVHVTIIDLAASNELDVSLLTDAEHAYAARYRFEADRKRFITGRTALRRLLDHRDEFRLGEHGKPMLDGAHFNVSHSGDRVLIAVGDTPVGVDVERIDGSRGVIEIADRYFSAFERAWIDAQPDRVRGFFQMWSRKEAVMKADGRGVFLGLLEVRIDAARALATADGVTWQLTEIDAGADYAACVAAAPGTEVTT